MNQVAIVRIGGIFSDGLPLAKVIGHADALIKFAVFADRANFHAYAARKAILRDQLLMIDGAGLRVEVRDNLSRMRLKRMCGTEPAAKPAALAEILFHNAAAGDLGGGEQRNITHARSILSADEVVTEAYGAKPRILRSVHMTEAGRHFL